MPGNIYIKWELISRKIKELSYSISPVSICCIILYYCIILQSFYFFAVVGITCNNILGHI